MDVSIFLLLLFYPYPESQGLQKPKGEMVDNIPQKTMFKKIKLFATIVLLAIVALSISSYSKESKIEGKWKITKASGDASVVLPLFRPL